MVTEGIRSNDMTEFRDKLAEAKMIIIDDIQFLRVRMSFNVNLGMF